MRLFSGLRRGRSFDGGLGRVTAYVGADDSGTMQQRESTNEKEK
jgi:hypothetical protein